MVPSYITHYLKTALLLGSLSGLILLIGGLVGGFTGLIVSLVIALIFNFTSYWFSDKIVLSMYKAKKATIRNAPVLMSMVRDLSKKANLPMPAVYVIDTPNPNAFATGRNPAHAAVAVTTGIVEILTKEELEGVIAHELAHIKNRDILISTIAACIATAITFVGMSVRWMMLLGRGGNRPSGAEFLVMGILAPLIATLLQLGISRSREYLADETGARIHGTGKYLASALEQLESQGRRRPMRQAKASTASMFIVNPLSGAQMRGFFSTHPPTSERVKRLKSLKV